MFAEKCHGWWKVDDEPTVGLLETALLQKGTREQILLNNLRKGIDAVIESSKKVAPDEIEIEDYDDEDEVHTKPFEEIVTGVAAADDPNSWNKEVALRADKYILEQVEALEDKVASASMQVPVRSQFLRRFVWMTDDHHRHRGFVCVTYYLSL